MQRKWKILETANGPNRHSALVFAEYAEEIRRETGIDVYERKATVEADRPVIRRLLDKFRKDRTFADESLLDAIWQEYLRDLGILSNEEQQAKDEYALANARAAKDALRESGMADAPRFGYCSRSKGCKNAKERRLLLRGFCLDCRGVTVQQTRASGGTSYITVTVDATKINSQVLELTTEERREKVLLAKQQNPTASVREIVKVTGVPFSTVRDILKNPIVRTKPENTAEVKQFLRERAETLLQLRKS